MVADVDASAASVCVLAVPAPEPVGLRALLRPLVPLPTAADDHQTFNAEHLVTHGAAVRVAEGEGFQQRLAQAIAALAEDPALRLSCAMAARALAKPEAAREVAEAILAEANA